MQHSSVGCLGISVTSGDSAPNHSDHNRMFLPVAYRGGPEGLPEPLDNPAFLYSGADS